MPYAQPPSSRPARPCATVRRPRGTNRSERFRSEAFLPAHRLARSLICLQDVARNVIPAYVRCPAALLTACSVVWGCSPSSWHKPGGLTTADAYLPARRFARSSILLRDVVRNVIPSQAGYPAALLWACPTVCSCSPSWPSPLHGPAFLKGVFFSAKQNNDKKTICFAAAEPGLELVEPRPEKMQHS